jgi:hypothetical protein
MLVGIATRLRYLLGASMAGCDIYFSLGSQEVLFPHTSSTFLIKHPV